MDDNVGWQTLALAGIRYSVRMLDGVDMPIDIREADEEVTEVDGHLPELVGGAWHIPEDIPERDGEIVAVMVYGPNGYRRQWRRIGGDS